MNTDGNLAALNDYIAQLDSDSYEQDWKDEHLNSFIDEKINDITEKGYFTDGAVNGLGQTIRHTLLDVICDSDNDHAVSDALKMIMCGEDASVYQDELNQILRDELEHWCDADKAFEQHCEDNEPQEY